MSTTPAPIVKAYAQYRPPQWSKAAMVSITVPAATSAYTITSDAPGAPVGSGTVLETGSVPIGTATSYVFDAVLEVEHEQTLTKTMHPVQNGGALTSHAYLNPSSVVMYVLMSDVVGQYVTANQTAAPYIQQWTGNGSKSVSAYQQMLKLQTARVPLTVATRLRTYTNMLVLRISPREDSKTINGARFRVEFGQIFLASVQTNPVSARPNDTNSTGLGTTSTGPATANINNMFMVPPGSLINTLPNTATGEPTNGTTAQPTYVNVPGAGTYSSTPQQFGSGGSQ